MKPEELTLRDYFAIRSLPVAVEVLKSQMMDDGCGQFNKHFFWRESDALYFARASYLLADAMLKARDAEDLDKLVED